MQIIYDIFFFFCKQATLYGYHESSHRFFLILITSLVLFRLSGVLTALIEISLHVWAHRKNKNNTNQTIYYQSPLHVVTKQFCAICRERNVEDKVSQMQDRRLKGWRFQLENVARRIS